MKMFKSGLLAVAVVALLGAFKVGNYGVGDTVADFKLKSVDGKIVSLADFKYAKGVIVVFDCNTCPYSKAYNERIIALDKKFSAKKFPLIAINSNDPGTSAGDSFEAMVSYAEEKGYTFPYLFDENQSVAKAFGATNTPHAFVLAKEQNNFIVKYIGAIDSDVKGVEPMQSYVEDAVRSLLSGKKVQTPKTKAIGCGIKWKRLN